MKKIIAYILVGLLCLGAIGGLTYSLTHKKQADKPVDEVVEELSSEEALKKAEEYLKTIYKDVEKETPRDYERIGVVPIGKLKFQVTWSVDVSEEYVKIVVNDNGIVTIDVNEECGEEIPYILTATIKDEKGNIRKLTWEHVIPKKITGSYQEIVDMAYALKPGESMKNEATLQGTVTTINTPWDSGYKNITVTIIVEGREDKPIQCYRMKSGAADASKVEKGDLITVTGILKNYNGTIEFDAGCILEANEKGAGKITKVKGTYQEIVDKAYALKAGESLKGEATLQGSVTAINTAWNPDYKNITVTIVVDGRETKPIQCYRLKSGAADASKIQKGDLITVTGMLKNYNGTIEFEAGCILDANQKGAGKINTVKGSYQEIVDKAYALASGEVLAGEATLQGTVTAINTAWSSSFKNITVTIVVEGRESKPIQCYRMKSGAADASKVEKGDLITVTGILKNYNGTIEFDAGCVLDANKKGAGTINTVTGTMQDIVDKGYALEEGASLNGEATLTGSVTSVDTPYNADFKNVTVTIVVEGRENKPIKCYRMKGTNADKVAVGDKITVTGIIKNYKGTIEFDAGCVMTDWVQGGGSYVPDEPDVPVVPDEPDVPVVPEEPSGTNEKPAYKGVLQLYQGNTKQTLYFAGTVANKDYYLATTTDVEEAVEVNVENVEGGVRLYYMNGDVKTYIDIYKNGSYVNARLTTEPTAVYEYNEEYNTYVADIDGTDYYLGTYNTYTTISASKFQFISTSFPVSVEKITYAYKFYSEQGNTHQTLFFNGGVANKDYYLGTTTNKEEAVDVYIEEVEGGVRFYFFKQDVKTYIDIYKNGNYVNARLTTAPTGVYVFSEEYNTYVVNVEGTNYYLGTYGTYTTISASKVDYISTSFPAVLGNPDDTAATLADAVAALAAEYAAEMNVTGEYALAPSIAINSTEFTVTWSIQTADETVAKIVDGKLVIVASTTKEVEYTLTATITDANNATETWSKTSTVKKAETNKKPAHKSVLQLYQANTEQTLYFAGTVANKDYYLATTTNLEEAVEVNVENVEGGVRLYYMNGDVKTYIDIYKSGSYVNARLTTDPTAVYVYNEQYNTYVANIGGTDYYLGTYNTYTTISASKFQFISTSFPASVEKIPYTYKFYSEQGNTNQTLFFNGGVANKDYYLGTTTNQAEAVDVYIEEVEGGVRFYFLKESVKTYIDIYKNGNYVNARLTTAPTGVYVFSEEYNTYVVNVEGTNYYLGTYGTYTTISASKVDFISTSFPAVLGNPVVSE